MLVLVFRSTEKEYCTGFISTRSLKWTSRERLVSAWWIRISDPRVSRKPLGLPAWLTDKVDSSFFVAQTKTQTRISLFLVSRNKETNPRRRLSFVSSRQKH